MLKFPGRKRKDPFDERKSLMEVWRMLQKVVDWTTPNLTPSEGEARVYKRHNRAIPVLIVELENGKPVLDRSWFAVTKDLAEQGVSIIINGPMEQRNLLCAFWVELPLIFAAEARQSTPIGGGFWQVGLRLTRVVRVTEMEELLPFMDHLKPDSKG